MTHSITFCTVWIRTHNRCWDNQDASPPKSPEKAESFGPDDPLKAFWPPLGSGDPLEAFWPLGVAGLPKMALMLESLVAAPHRQTVRQTVIMLISVPDTENTQAKDTGMNTFQLHADMCYTCNDTWALAVPVRCETLCPDPLCSHDTHAQCSNCQLSNLFVQSQQSSSRRSKAATHCKSRLSGSRPFLAMCADTAVHKPQQWNRAT